MAIYGPAPGSKGRSFELWVLHNRRDLNFCIRSSPLRERDNRDSTKRKRERDRDRLQRERGRDRDRDRQTETETDLRKRKRQRQTAEKD